MWEAEQRGTAESKTSGLGSGRAVAGSRPGPGPWGMDESGIARGSCLDHQVQVQSWSWPLEFRGKVWARDTTLGVAGTEMGLPE